MEKRSRSLKGTHQQASRSQPQKKQKPRSLSSSKPLKTLTKKSIQKSDQDDKKYTKFNPEILKAHIHLQDFIEKDPKNDRRIICVPCKQNNQTFNGYYEHLAVHLNSDNHRSSVAEARREEISEAIAALKNFRSQKKKVLKVPRERINSMRTEITSFLIKKELPLAIAPDLILFFQNMIHKYKPEEIERLTMCNKTSTQILKQMIKFYKEKLFEDLNCAPFALSFDESTDIYGPCYLCTHVRYIKNGQIINKLLALNELADDITGEKLFSIVHDQIFPPEKHHILKTNLIGVCTDRGSNMLSTKKKGLANRLAERYPQILVAHDFSHLFHLIVKASLLKFPVEVLNLVKGICSHFSRSALRRVKFTQVQKELSDQESVEIKSILKYVDHRWMSLMNAAERIILLWFSLERYFDQEPDENVNPLLNEENQTLIELLLCFLKKLNSMISFFESDDQDYSSIMPKLKDVFILMGLLVIKEEFIERTSPKTLFESMITLPFENKDKIKTYLQSDDEFENNFLNKYSEFKLSLLLKNQNFKKKFFLIAQNFILESLIEMYKRIPFKNELLNNCEALQLISFDREKWMSLFKHFKEFAKINASDLEHELDLLYIRFETLKSQKDNMNNLVSFWFSKNKEFPLISKIALTAYTLPYSSAGVERAFSVLKDIKSSKRNRMCSETLEASLLIHQSLNNISDFQIEDDLLLRINTMWQQPSSILSQAESLEGNFFLLFNHFQF